MMLFILSSLRPKHPTPSPLWVKTTSPLMTDGFCFPQWNALCIQPLRPLVIISAVLWKNAFVISSTDLRYTKLSSP